MKGNVSVIIPAYNEAKKIKETISAVLSIPEVKEVVVVDDASIDGTPELAKQAGARVYTLPENCGKGAALNFGAARISYDVIALLDADLGTTASEARRLMLPVLKGQVDMTVARFPPPRKKGGFGLVKGLAKAAIKYHTGLVMYSPLSGQRVMTREVMEKILPFASGYGVEVILTIKVAKMGYRVKEIPVNMRHAETGRNIRGFMHRGRQCLDILKALARLNKAGVF